MTRTVGTPTCTGGSCQLIGNTEQQLCMVQTEGLSCGPDKVYNEWSDCYFPDVCQARGLRDRRIDTYTCMNQRCDFTSEMEIDNQTCVQMPPIDGTSCAPDAQCCSGTCTPKNDPANCNVCGFTCTQGQGCTPFIAGDGSMQWACECREPSDCRPYYGMSPECLNAGPISLCSCQCPQGDCTGQCSAGSCYISPPLNYCGY
jgi:hypothetical protein